MVLEKLLKDPMHEVTKRDPGGFGIQNDDTAFWILAPTLSCPPCNQAACQRAGGMRREATRLVAGRATAAECEFVPTSPLPFAPATIGLPAGSTAACSNAGHPGAPRPGIAHVVPKAQLLPFGRGREVGHHLRGRVRWSGVALVGDLGTSLPGPGRRAQSG